MMIDKITLLFDPSLEDSVINIYISRATVSIVNYLNNPLITEAVVVSKYEDAIILLVENTFMMRETKFISSESQGARSTSYSDKTTEIIPEEVKRLLPYPFLRFR